jgi:hypothetical protein
MPLVELYWPAACTASSPPTHTQVVQLPVHEGHTGGALQVRGPDRAHAPFTWDTAEGSSSAVKYCAFYADVGQWPAVRIHRCFLAACSPRSPVAVLQSTLWSRS